MKLKSFYTAFLLCMLATLSGCEVIGGIFKAGVWSGIIVVVIVIALILFLIGKMGKK